MNYDGMTRTEQVDSWFARLTAWMREVCGPKSVPPMPPPFVWDELRLRAAALDGNEACVAAVQARERAALTPEPYVPRSTSGLAGQPPAPIDQLDAHDSAATQAAVALLKNVAHHLDEADVAHHLDEAVLARCTSASLADLRSDVRRALELLGVKP